MSDRLHLISQLSLFLRGPGDRSYPVYIKQIICRLRYRIPYRSDQTLHVLTPDPSPVTAFWLSGYNSKQRLQLRFHLRVFRLSRDLSFPEAAGVKSTFAGETREYKGPLRTAEKTKAGWK